MRPQFVVPITLIAAVAAYAIAARHFRHKELMAEAIAYGATRRALEAQAGITGEPVAVVLTQLHNTEKSQS